MTVEDATRKPLLAAQALALASGDRSRERAGGGDCRGRPQARARCLRRNQAFTQIRFAADPHPPALASSRSHCDAVTEASLRKFLAEPHGETRRNSAMPAFLLPASRVDGVVAYILSRKPK